MTSEERREWLAGLKVGDEVALCEKRCGSPDLLKITGETPDVLFVGHGRYVMRATGTSTWGVIKPITDENRIRLSLHEAWIDADYGSKLPIATVRNLLAVLAEAEQQGEESK